MTQILDPSPRLRSIATRRSLIQRLAVEDEHTWQDDWQLLFTLYAPAVGRYARSLLTRGLRRPVGDDEVEDLVQAYFATAMDKGWLGHQVEGVRCFRAYLQTQVRRFVANDIARRFAARRDEGRTLDLEAPEDLSVSMPEAAAELDAAWLEVALDVALKELRGRNENYAEVIADLRRTHGEGSPDLSVRLGKTDTQLVHLRHRARRRYAILVFEHLQKTVADPEAFEALCERLRPHFP